MRTATKARSRNEEVAAIKGRVQEIVADIRSNLSLLDEAVAELGGEGQPEDADA